MKRNDKHGLKANRGRKKIWEVMHSNIEKSLSPDMDTKLLKHQLNERIMFSKDLINMFGITYRQVNAWDELGVEMGERQSNKPQAWRKFSIIDIINIAILLELRCIGIPVSEGKVMLKWFGESNRLEDATREFLKGKKGILYFDYEKNSADIYYENSDKEFIDTVRTGKLGVVLNLYVILYYVLLKTGDVRYRF